MRRTQLKAQYLMSLETSEGLLEAIGTHALAEATYHTPEAMSQKIDAVSSNDVVSVSVSLHRVSGLWPITKMFWCCNLVLIWHHNKWCTKLCYSHHILLFFVSV